MVEDPARLTDEGGTALMRSLLSAAREEQPKAAAIQHTLTVIGVGAALTTLAGSGSAATAVSSVSGQGAVGAATALGSTKGAVTTSLMVMKWLGAGLVAGIVGTSVTYRVSQAPPAPTLATKLAETALVEPAARAEPHATAAAASARSAETPGVSPAAKAAPSVSAAASSPVAAAGVSVPAEVDPDAQVAAELALLDHARQALASGGASAALHALDEYDQRFAHPNLLPEALYLRLEALTLQGNGPGAEAVARRMLRSFPRGPHAARARAVLGLEN